jgi:hypothetical protein
MQQTFIWELSYAKIQEQRISKFWGPSVNAVTLEKNWC